MDVQTAESWLLELQGPRLWTEPEARRVIEAWKASGETVSAFARRAGLLRQRVYCWRERLGFAPAKEAAAVHEALEMSVPAFLPVTVSAPLAPSASAAVTVCTRDGLRIEVAELDAMSAAWVASLVRSLAESS
jgi:hypothetical protein